MASQFEILNQLEPEPIVEHENWGDLVEEESSDDEEGIESKTIEYQPKRKDGWKTAGSNKEKRSQKKQWKEQAFDEIMIRDGWILHRKILSKVKERGDELRINFKELYKMKLQEKEFQGKMDRGIRRENFYKEPHFQERVEEGYRQILKNHGKFSIKVLGRGILSIRKLN